MTGPVLAVGDGFVLVSLLRDALREHVGGELEIREHELRGPSSRSATSPRCTRPVAARTS